MTLVDERNSWRDKFEQGDKPKCRVLEDYRRNRDGVYWRASRNTEELCEYILYLENRLDEIVNNVNSHYNDRNQTR